MSYADEPSARPGRSPGVERWHVWLSARLSPAVVTLSDRGSVTPNEFRWKVEFPSGVTSHIRIPRMVVQAGTETFERTTRRMEGYGWVEALELAGPRGLRVTTWGET